MRYLRHSKVCVAGLVLLAGAAALAQEKPAGGERRSFMGLINIDSLVENYSNFLARKYNLNPEQDDFTHQLLREKAHQFWDKNEGQLSTLMDRMFEVRTGGDMAPDELINWGKSVLPLYNDAKNIIVDGNSEWREILTEEQRKIHDEDLKLMEQSFKTTDDQIERIVTGAMTVDEFRSPSRGGGRNRNQQAKPEPPPAQPVVSDSPPPPEEMSPERAEKQREHDEQMRSEQGMQEPKERPVDEETQETVEDAAQESARLRAEKAEQHRRESEGEEQPVEQPVEQPPHDGSQDAPPPQPEGQPPHRDPRQPSKGPAVGKGFEGEWEQYTRQFIARFKLNDEQTQRANAILADCKEQGVRHMNSKKSEIERADARLAELQRNKDAGKSAEVATLTQQKQKLMEPLTRIFEQQLKPRLEKIPTRAQRDAAETAAKTSAGGASARPATGGAKVAPSPAGSAGRKLQPGGGKP